jgi:hypothetical protein
MKYSCNKIIVIILFVISGSSFADSFSSLTERGYSLALSSAVGNGNSWMYLINARDMYICLNLPGVNRIDNCKYVYTRGGTNYTDLLENGGKIISSSAVGNGNVWLTFINGSRTTTCLAMPGINTIECK